MLQQKYLRRLTLLSLTFAFSSQAQILPERGKIDGWLSELGAKTALMNPKLSTGAFYRGLFIPLKWD